MSILSDWEIDHNARVNQMISPYTPELIQKNVASHGLSSFGYDFKLKPEDVWEYRPSLYYRVANLLADLTGLHYPLVIDYKRVDLKAVKESGGNRFIRPCKIHRDESGIYVVIRPNSFILGTTVEYVRMPSNVTCTLHGKSTQTRVGIIIPPNVLEAGWMGEITTEVQNSLTLPNKLYLNEGIFQGLFWRGSIPQVTYADRKGKYQGQTGTTFPKLA